MRIVMKCIGPETPYYIHEMIKNSDGSTRIALTKDLNLAMNFGPGDSINGYISIFLEK